ncbi:MAG: LacI family DNA-binding transcriptional regulator [Cryobacterium sp.]
MTTDSAPATGLPTLEMVAAAAGVSRATVSRVVNGSPKVRPEVQALVQTAIDELHYVPNRAARSLVNRRTQVIALVVPENLAMFFGDPYFAAIVQGITRRLNASDYMLNLLVAASDPGSKTTRYLRSGNVDGALIVSHHTGDAFVAGIVGALPLVFGGRPSIEAAADVYSVDVDNTAGAADATRYLIDAGRRRIGAITGPLDMPAGLDRFVGFTNVMAEAGLDAHAVEHADFTAAGAARAADRLLDRVPDLDALFVASDLMATGVLDVLRARGRAVPDDVAVVGFDDSPSALAASVPLTTIRQPSEEAGYLMADGLLRLLAGDTDVIRRTILPTTFVKRASA